MTVPMPTEALAMLLALDGHEASDCEMRIA
jgi:hypothetical protein